jgi:divalent metal cation (Fe/Co/Zn/Cd) transporter
MTATSNQTAQTSLTRFAWLSIAAAVITIGLKTAAYWLTGSVGLLSDALESLVNLVAAIMALAMLTLAARPADEEHAYGHTKAEYFSSGRADISRRANQDRRAEAVYLATYPGSGGLDGAARP